MRTPDGDEIEQVTVFRLERTDEPLAEIAGDKLRGLVVGPHHPFTIVTYDDGAGRTVTLAGLPLKVVCRQSGIVAPGRGIVLG